MCTLYYIVYIIKHNFERMRKHKVLKVRKTAKQMNMELQIHKIHNEEMSWINYE